MGYNIKHRRVKQMKNEELILQMLGELKAGQEKLETEVRRTRMLVEQQDHKISLIAEQYTDIAEKLDKANDRAAQIDDMRDRLRTLETVVMNHTAVLKDLRKAE
jgi:hypothetical protein